MSIRLLSRIGWVTLIVPILVLVGLVALWFGRCPRLVYVGEVVDAEGVFGNNYRVLPDMKEGPATRQSYKSPAF